jgi:hypothetical protein
LCNASKCEAYEAGLEGGAHANFRIRRDSGLRASLIPTMRYFFNSGS